MAIKEYNGTDSAESTPAAEARALIAADAAYKNQIRTRPASPKRKAEVNRK